MNASLTGQCHASQVVTLNGANFARPVYNVTLSGRYTYTCLTPTLVSAQYISCVLPATAWEDEGRWLNVTVRTANGTASIASAVQSYGLLSVTSASGCIKQAANVTSGCAPGGNVSTAAVCTAVLPSTFHPHSPLNLSC